MKRRRTPQEKKRLEYTKDHTTPSSHGFSKSLPRERARANQAYRRLVHQRVAAFEVHEEDDVPERLRPEQVRRKRVRKDYGSVNPMGEVIKDRLHGRIIAPFWNFIRDEYNSSSDREKFVGFLTAQVGGRTEISRELAQVFRKLIVLRPDPTLTDWE